MADNININSFNQSGGITAHTVNISPQRRQLDQATKDQIIREIPKSASIQVTSVMGDGEAFNYATEILNFLKSNNYLNVDGVNQGVYSQPVFGQHCEKSPDNSQFTFTIGTKEN